MIIGTFQVKLIKENQVRYKNNMMTLLPSQKKLYSSLWTRANLPFLPWSNLMLFQIVCLVHWLLALFLLAIAMKHSMELLPEGYHRQAIQNHYRRDLPKGQDRLDHGLRSIKITNHNYWLLLILTIIPNYCTISQSDRTQKSIICNFKYPWMHPIFKTKQNYLPYRWK